MVDERIEELMHFLGSVARFLQWLWFVRWPFLFGSLSSGQTRRDKRRQRPLGGRVLISISKRHFILEEEDNTLVSEFASHPHSIALPPQNSDIVGSGDLIVRSGTVIKQKSVRNMS
jgi:hypothetical protein